MLVTARYPVVATCTGCSAVLPIFKLTNGKCPSCTVPEVLLHICKGCGISFPATRADHQFHDEACYARYQRKQMRLVTPVSGLRTFTCKTCGKAWETAALGHFSTCEECKAAKAISARQKTCAYRHCDITFTDTSKQNSMQFCCPKHREQEKAFRSGKAKDESYFRENKPKLSPICMSCGHRWYRAPEDKSVRCLDCRQASRRKVCAKCCQFFEDTSLKATCKYCPSCAQKASVLVRGVPNQDELERKRQGNTRVGFGRLDDITTVRKYTHTWWGRVAELVFKAYREKAQDMVAEQGAKAVFDFQDPTYGRVNVKGAKERVSPEGRAIWGFPLRGLKVTADTVFLLGFAKDRQSVTRMWLTPIGVLPESIVFFAPGSKEYKGAPYEVAPSWGLAVANKVLQECLALPEPQVCKDRFAWMDDPKQLRVRAPGHRGRRGELLYKLLYPTSADMNRTLGSNAPYDFQDADGTKVNVKTSRWYFQSAKRFGRWAFALGSSPAPNCDVYSCLCLDASNVLVREYRIPVSAWGSRTVLHIYDNGKWENYRIPLKQEGLQLQLTEWNQKLTRDLTVPQAESILRQLSLDDTKIAEKVLAVILRTKIPLKEYEDSKLLRDFELLCSSQVAVIQNVVQGFSGVGASLCNRFFKHKYDACYQTNPSARDAWGDPYWLRRAIKFQLRLGSSLMPWSLFRALCVILRAPTNFRPTVAKALVEAYCPKGGTVLDPCAGYGGRAVGALAVGRKYVGVDPHPNALRAFSELFEFMQAPIEWAKLHQAPIEDVSLGALQADFAFTSPPYFSVERYANNTEQSWVRYPNWELWCANFLAPMFTKVWQHLAPGAAFCLNVQDVICNGHKYNLVQDSIRLGQQVGFLLEATLTLPLGRFGKAAPKTEPILVFRKPTL